MTQSRTLTAAEVDAVGGGFSCYYPLPPFQPFGPTIFWPEPTICPIWEPVDLAA